MDRGIIFGTDPYHVDNWKGDLAGFLLQFPNLVVPFWGTDNYIATTILENHIEDGPVQSTFFFFFK